MEDTLKNMIELFEKFSKDPKVPAELRVESLGCEIACRRFLLAIGELRLK